MTQDKPSFKKTKSSDHHFLCLFVLITTEVTQPHQIDFHINVCSRALLEYIHHCVQSCSTESYDLIKPMQAQPTSVHASLCCLLLIEVINDSYHDTVCISILHGRPSCVHSLSHCDMQLGCPGCRFQQPIHQFKSHSIFFLCKMTLQDNIFQRLGAHCLLQF